MNETNLECKNECIVCCDECVGQQVKAMVVDGMQEPQM